VSLGETSDYLSETADRSFAEVDRRRGRRGEISAPQAVGLAIAIVTTAVLVGHAVPTVGAPVSGLLLGVLIGLPLRLGAAARQTTAFIARYGLQAAIVLLGATLQIQQVLRVGVRSIPVMIATLLIALFVARRVGRALKVTTRLQTLVGVGTGICGASAIAAISGVIGATEIEIAYAVSTVFAFNIVAVLLFPPLGHWFGLGQSAFGVWAGTAVNDTSSVVATSYAFGNQAAAHAVIVKLTRTTMIIPVVIALASRTRRETNRRPVHARSVFPWFIIWFLAAVLINSSGVIPRGTSPHLSQGSSILITVALASVGIAADVGQLRAIGYRPLVLGLCVWSAVAITSLLLVTALGE
jgi:uncharacterized integral membrane protein (TIGR00698 family)